jgi:hypothetical protein
MLQGGDGKPIEHLSIGFFFFGAAGEHARGEQADDEADAKNNADGLIRAIANGAVGGLGTIDSFLFYFARAGFEQFLPVAHDGFDIFQKSFEIHVVAVTGFMSHGEFMTRKSSRRNGVFTVSNNGLRIAHAVEKTGCFPHYLKTLKLINYINLAEIVKNFTNFTCGIGEGAIKFRRSTNRPASAFGRAGI